MKPWVHAIITSTENHNLSARLNIIQCKGGRVLGRIRSNRITTELRGIEIGGRRIHSRWGRLGDHHPRRNVGWDIRVVGSNYERRRGRRLHRYRRHICHCRNMKRAVMTMRREEDGERDYRVEKEE